jgi:DNA-binding beta-propeller fold protein YncE
MNATKGGRFMKFSSLGRLAVGVSFLLFGAYTLASPPAVSYHLLKKVPLPAAPGGTEYFDYLTVDADARRVYVSHGTEVVVLNADDYSVVGTIGGLQRCHGVIVIKGLGKGYITDGEAQEVVIFDLKTLKITGKVKTNQPDTDSIIYDPASKHIFTFNGNSHNTTVIDPVKETVLKTIDLAGGVEFPAVDGKGMLYDNNEEKNDVVAIDTRTLAIKARWPVAPEGQAVAMAMDTKNRRLFSAGRNPQFLVMMDADNGKVIQSFPITAGVDANVFEPATGLLFVSTREGMIHIFHEDSPDKLSEVETVKTEYGAKTMQLDPKTHNIFLSTSDFDPPAAPTEKQPHPLPRAKPGNFRVLVYGR